MCQLVIPIVKFNLGKKCVDIGCGIGGVMHDLAFTGADLVGVTIAGNEVIIGNKRFQNEGLENCTIMQGNYCCLPLVDSHYDCAYAVSSIKDVLFTIRKFALCITEIYLKF